MHPWSRWTALRRRRVVEDRWAKIGSEDPVLYISTFPYTCTIVLYCSVQEGGQLSGLHNKRLLRAPSDPGVAATSGRLDTDHLSRSRFCALLMHCTSNLNCAVHLYCTVLYTFISLYCTPILYSITSAGGDSSPGARLTTAATQPPWTWVRRPSFRYVPNSFLFQEPHPSDLTSKS